MTKLGLWLSSILASFGDDSTYTNSEELVERARNGDQVAIATISCARKNAEKGNKKAIQTIEEVKRYAKKTAPTNFMPVGAEDTASLREACFGEDVEKIGPSLSKVALIDPMTAAVTVANSTGNAMELAKRLDEIVQSKAFKASFNQPNILLEAMKKVDHDTQHALLLGFVLGMATRIQLVRKPNVPIAVFSKQVAMELGQ